MKLKEIFLLQPTRVHYMSLPKLRPHAQQLCKNFNQFLEVELICMIIPGEMMSMYVIR